MSLSEKASEEKPVSRNPLYDSLGRTGPLSRPYQKLHFISKGLKSLRKVYLSFVPPDNARAILFPPSLLIP